MTVHIKPFDSTKAPDEVLEKVIDFQDEFRKELSPDDPPFPREIALKELQNPHPHRERVRFLAWIDDEIVGASEIGWMKEEAPGYEKNKHIGSIDVRVKREYRGQGIAKKLLVPVLEASEKNPNLTTIFGGSWHDAGRSLCEKLGGKFSQEGAENRLELKDVDWNMIKEWNEKGLDIAKKEGITLQFFEDCPEDIIEEYCMVYQETMNQQPLGEYDGEITITPESRRLNEARQRERGLKWYTLITKEKDGRISGLTEILYHPSIPEKAFQNLTGVKQEYRGRGLGKLLKAHMLLWITEKFPEIKTIVTGNDVTNKPMLSINTRMGFKKHIGVTEYVFDLKALKERFQSISP